MKKAKLKDFKKADCGVTNRRFLPVLDNADLHVSHFVVDNIAQLD